MINLFNAEQLIGSLLNYLGSLLTLLPSPVFEVSGCRFSAAAMSLERGSPTLQADFMEDGVSRASNGELLKGDSLPTSVIMAWSEGEGAADDVTDAE